ncbi:hypothetical protein [Rhodanobacter denitrificans]|uniref:hypothetical protein n=1 Tax=Rhodanobacter denitrificans TaxID=666685 RepID=UPI00166FEEF3|nr:hypothetical protein [Rhodanobacter denitrificans]
MTPPVVPIASLMDLVSALSGPGPRTLELQTSVACPFSISLPPGFVLTGRDRDSCLLVFGNGDGIGLTADNRVAQLTVVATPAARAIYTQTGLADMGRIALEDLTVTGQVSIITRAGTDKLDLGVDKLHIAACDCRRYSEQPQKYGVNVYQGALTVYNFSGDTKSTIRASLTDISVGAKNAPVLGSGIFVSGFGDQGGWVQVDKLTTGAVYSCGMLPYGTADIITAGVFIVYGANAKLVEHFGEVVTYGVNDMVLDTWGTVEQWIAHAPVVSYGPSGIGFVNFGTVGHFVAEREIVTHGLGARGFNQYDGTVKHIRFKSIETFGDGSIGIQVSKPVGTIVVDEGITTHGSVGNTLVKGVNMQLPAEAFSVKPGGSVEKLEVHGDLVTHGANVTTYAVEGGKVGAVDIKGSVLAHGKDSDAVLVAGKGSTPLTNVRASAAAGKTLVVEDGEVTDRTGWSG